MFVALALVSGACSTNILHGIDERAANDAARALERAGIGAEKIGEESSGAGAGTRFTLRVARGDEARALDLLRALGLPREPRHGFSETYGQPSLIPTPSEERARYVDALAGELERTLETVDGVVSARVHLVLEEADPLAVDAKPRSAARAAVLIAERPGHPPIAREDVQRLVAGSVAGLDAAAVSVVVTAAPAGHRRRAHARGHRAAAGHGRQSRPARGHARRRARTAGAARGAAARDGAPARRARARAAASG